MFDQKSGAAIFCSISAMRAFFLSTSKRVAQRRETLFEPPQLGGYLVFHGVCVRSVK
jgi:hypothetical protein